MVSVVCGGGEREVVCGDDESVLRDLDADVFSPFVVPLLPDFVGDELSAFFGESNVRSHIRPEHAKKYVDGANCVLFVLLTNCKMFYR
jgi:hypothetical protein